MESTHSGEYRCVFKGHVRGDDVMRDPTSTGPACFPRGRCQLAKRGKPVPRCRRDDRHDLLAAALPPAVRFYFGCS